jgi:hypothetical protein
MEWEDAKTLIKKFYKDHDDAYELFFNQYGDNYNELLTIYQISKTLPISNAITERAFSIQNLIKNKLKYFMSSDLLDYLMRIAIEGQNIEEFPFIEAYEI